MTRADALVLFARIATGEEPPALVNIEDIGPCFLDRPAIFERDGSYSRINRDDIESLFELLLEKSLQSDFWEPSKEETEA